MNQSRQATAAREGARRPNGQFGEQFLREGDVAIDNPAEDPAWREWAGQFEAATGLRVEQPPTHTIVVEDDQDPDYVETADLDGSWPVMDVDERDELQFHVKSQVAVTDRDGNRIEVHSTSTAAGGEWDYEVFRQVTQIVTRPDGTRTERRLDAWGDERGPAEFSDFFDACETAADYERGQSEPVHLFKSGAFLVLPDNLPDPYQPEDH